MSHAEVCLDLRPQGVVGRETLESLLLGTPVVVPEGTVAAEHAERSNGGLWYRDYSELFAHGQGDPGQRVAAGFSLEQGREWAERVHGDQRRFSSRWHRLALGVSPVAGCLPPSAAGLTWGPGGASVRYVLCSRSGAR